MLFPVSYQLCLYLQRRTSKGPFAIVTEKPNQRMEQAEQNLGRVTLALEGKSITYCLRLLIKIETKVVPRFKPPPCFDADQEQIVSIGHPRFLEVSCHTTASVIGGFPCQEDV